MGGAVDEVDVGHDVVPGTCTQKMYHWHSGYPGGIKSTSFERMIKSKPERVIEIAVKGMLPKGPLGRDMFRKLKVYPGPDHRHAAQQPKTLSI